MIQLLAIAGSLLVCTVLAVAWAILHVVMAMIEGLLGFLAKRRKQ